MTSDRLQAVKHSISNGPMHNMPPLPDNSPIASLSQELLTLIFGMVHASFNDDPSNREAERARAKVFITASHVSRYWRSMALGNPLWWSTIVMRPTWNTDAINSYLKRSKECLLDLSLFGYVDLPTHSNYTASQHSIEEHQVVFDLVFPHFSRCRRLQVRGFFYQDIRLPFSTLEKLLDADMPNLEEFIFEGDLSGFEQHLAMRGVKPLFDSAPLLQNLGVMGVVIGQFCQPPPLLTSLHLIQGLNTDHTSFEDLKMVLNTCHSITTLAIYDDLLYRPLGDTIDVPSLESLFILGNMLTVSELLLFLYAPNLREMVIAPVMFSDLNDFGYEAKMKPDFYLQHFPSLTSLTLAPAHYDTFNAVEKASICFPHIERLILANIYLVPFTKVFARTVEDGVVFPKLQELALTSVDRTHAKAIHDVQEFRARKGYPLQNVYVDSESFEELQPCLSVESSSGGVNQEYAPFHLDLKEGNFWEVQRRRALSSEHKDVFVGRPSSRMDD